MNSEQLSSTQNELKRMKEEYAETVPRREYEQLEGEHLEIQGQLQHQLAQYENLKTSHKRATGTTKYDYLPANLRVYYRIDSC